MTGSATGCTTDPSYWRTLTFHDAVPNLNMCKPRSRFLTPSGLHFRSAFQSSNLIGWVRVYQGWVRVNLGCCQGNGAYAHIVVYNKLTNRIRALKSTSEQIGARLLLISSWLSSGYKRHLSSSPQSQPPKLRLCSCAGCQVVRKFTVALITCAVDHGIEDRESTSLSATASW